MSKLQGPSGRKTGRFPQMVAPVKGSDDEQMGYSFRTSTGLMKWLPSALRRGHRTRRSGS